MRRLAFAALALCLFTASAFAQTPPNAPPAVSPPGARPGAAQVLMPSPPKRGAQPFANEAAAKTGCQGDTVVWGNTSSKVLHAQGAPYYGKTKRGAFMCQHAAEAAGYRMSKTGN